jgi:hypothetical protein
VERIETVFEAQKNRKKMDFWSHPETQTPIVREGTDLDHRGRLGPTLLPMVSSISFAIIILMVVMVVLLSPLDPLDVARQARSCIRVERGGGRAAEAGALSLIAAGASCIAESAARSRTVVGIISAALLAFRAPRPDFPFPGSHDEVLDEVPDGWPGPPPHRISLRWFAPFFSSGGYSSEALSFVSYLKDIVQVGIVQHGDSVNEVRLSTGPPIDGAPAYAHARAQVWANVQIKESKGPLPP